MELLPEHGTITEKRTTPEPPSASRAEERTDPADVQDAPSRVLTAKDGTELP